MPKRVGGLTEQVLTEENCIKAVLIGTQKLKKTRYIRHIRKYADRYGKLIYFILKTGWVPKPTRTKIINEGTKRKVRVLTIPTQIDHLIHVAIMLPLIPILLKHYDYYSCGSIPEKGQKFANKVMKQWTSGGDYPYEFAAECDVQKFYPSCVSSEVMNCITRLVKDKPYLSWQNQILNQMGGVIAIGFTPSHWYGNLVLTKVDNALRQFCSKVKFVRYMDNYVLFAHTKEELHHAIIILKNTLEKMQLHLKNDWQIFSTSIRAPQLLSYRYFQNAVLLRKPTMYSISRHLKTAGHKLKAHFASGAISRNGLLKYCNSLNYKIKWVYPFINIYEQSRLVSDAAKKCLLCNAA